MPKLTPQIREEILAIKNPAIRSRWQKYYSIPEDLQNSMFEPDTAETIWDIINEKYQLGDTNVSKMARIIGLIFLGEMPIKNFIAEIKDKLGVDVAKAQAIAQDINQAIFQPVRQSLMAVHNITEQRMTNDQAQMPNQVQNPNVKIQRPVKLVPPANEPDYEATRRRNEVLNKLKNQPSGLTARPAGYYHMLRKNNVVNLKKLKKKNKYDGVF